MPANSYRLTAFSFVSVVLFLFSHAAANAATCIADPPNGAGFQDCLDSTIAGDTIVLPEGTYRPTNNVVFPSPQGNAFFIGKALTIIGEDKERVVLSGDLGVARALNVVIINTSIFGPGMVTLENLTITGGDAADGFFVGGGIIAADNESVALMNVRVVGNHAASAGGGVWTGSGSTWNISDSSFENNSADSFGGAIAMFCIFCGSDNSWSIVDSEFRSNSATNFGGAVDIFHVDAAPATNSYRIANSRFIDNHVDSSGVRGGAVNAAVSRVLPIAFTGEITDSTFRHNSGVIGGAVHVDGGDVVLSGNRFEHNEATVAGGGLYMDFSFGNRVDDNRFKHNVAGADGGAIFSRAVVVSMSGNDISHNCAGGSGGGLYNGVDEFVPLPITGRIDLIVDNELTHNQAQERGGAIANVSATIAEIRQSEISHNRASLSDPGIHDPDAGIITMTDVDDRKNSIRNVRCDSNEEAD